QFIGLDLGQPLPPQEFRELILDLAPAASGLLQYVDLLRVEAVTDLEWCCTQPNGEHIAETVGDVGAHHERAMTQRCRPHGGCRRQGRLADAALAGVEDEPWRGGRAH